MNRRRLLAALAATLAAPAFGKPKAPPVPAGSAALAAMRLGIEAVRVARGWCQAGMDLDAHGGAAAQAKAVVRFEQLWPQFRAGAPRFGQQEAVLLLEQRWRVYRMAFAAKPDAAGARRVISLSDDILGLARKSAGAIAQRGGGTAPLAVEVAQAQALVERLMRQVLARQWGVAPADVPIAIETDRKALGRLVGDLAATPGMRPEFVADMQLARQQLGFFEHALNPGADPAAAREMLRLGGRMNEVLESALARLPA